MRKRQRGKRYDGNSTQIRAQSVGQNLCMQREDITMKICNHGDSLGLTSNSWRRKFKDSARGKETSEMAIIPETFEVESCSIIKCRSLKFEAHEYCYKRWPRGTQKQDTASWRTSKNEIILCTGQ